MCSSDLGQGQETVGALGNGGFQKMVGAVVVGCHEDSRQTAQHPGYDEGWGKGCGLGRPKSAVIRSKKPLLSGAEPAAGRR